MVYVSLITQDTQKFLAVDDGQNLAAIQEGKTNPLSETFCRETIDNAADELTVLRAGKDFSRDWEPYRNLQFEQYVGVPIRVQNSLWGTLCLGETDSETHPIRPEFEVGLRLLSTLIGHEVERYERELHLDVLERVLRHNLRNSLTVIQGFLEARERPDAGDEFTATVEREVDSLLDLSRKSQLLREAFQDPKALAQLDLQEEIETVVGEIEAEYPEADIQFESTGLRTVRAHPRLGRAIYELLDNAVVHSHQEQPQVTIEVEDGAYVCLDVVDEGAGFPDAERQVLNKGEPITQMSHTSGLGLWLVRTIVQRSQGRLAIRETADRGAAVTLQLLPAEDAEPTDGAP